MQKLEILLANGYSQSEFLHDSVCHERIVNDNSFVSHKKNTEEISLASFI